jgi:hypothetical protein
MSMTRPNQQRSLHLKLRNGDIFRSRAETTDMEARALVSAASDATRKKTDRLRQQRLARDAEEAAAAEAAAAAAPPKTRTRKRAPKAE